MNKFTSFIIGHALAGIGGYLLVAGWSAGVADSGSMAGASLRVAAGIVRFVLLQPFGYWLVELVEPRWWTWPGLLGLIAICGVNSLCLAWVLRAVLRALAARSAASPD